MTLPPMRHDNGGRDKNLRSKRHTDWVRKHECVAHKLGNCRGRIEVCHARDIAPRGHGAGRPSDSWTFSACSFHHAQSEKREVAWSRETGIDVELACIEFAAASPDLRVKAEMGEYLRARNPAEIPV